MNIYEAILKRRTIRKFKQEQIPLEVLKKLANAARVAPSASNMQPLKYLIVNEKNKVKEIFKYISWAGAIRPEGNPKEGEEPTAYILMLCDKEVRKDGFDTDAGAAMENLILAGVEEGIGSCWMGAIDRGNITKLLSIPERFTIHTLVSLGYIGESPVMEDEEGSLKYYKDETGCLHVPKRKFEDVTYINKID